MIRSTKPRLSITSSDADYPESRRICKEKKVKIIAHTAEGSGRHVEASKSFTEVYKIRVRVAIFLWIFSRGGIVVERSKIEFDTFFVELSRSKIFVELRKLIMFARLEISAKDKLDFIESLLIPAFDPDNALNTSKERKEWMRREADQAHWDMTVANELIKRYGMVQSLEKAVEALERAEKNFTRQGKFSFPVASSSRLAVYGTLLFSVSVCFIFCA